MTNKQLQQRLLEAALMEDIAIPAGLEIRMRQALPADMPSRRPLYYGAAAVAALAIAVPVLIETSRHEMRYVDTCHSPEEAHAELQAALGVLQPTPASGDLLDLIQ